MLDTLHIYLMYFTITCIKNYLDLCIVLPTLTSADSLCKGLLSVDINT